MPDNRALCFAQSSLLCAIPYRLYPILLLSCLQGVFSLKLGPQKYRDRTLTSLSDRAINLLEPGFLTYFVTVFLILGGYLGFRTEPAREG